MVVDVYSLKIECCGSCFIKYNFIIIYIKIFV